MQTSSLQSTDNHEQRMNTLLLPRPDCFKAFPCLKQLVEQVKSKIKELVNGRHASWFGTRFDFLHGHMLKQGSLASQFRNHDDTEENTRLHKDCWWNRRGDGPPNLTPEERRAAALAAVPLVFEGNTALYVDRLVHITVVIPTAMGNGEATSMLVYGVPGSCS